MALETLDSGIFPLHKSGQQRAAMANRMATTKRALNAV